MAVISTETTPWVYRVFVSKDSPNNVNRGFFHRLPDNEYSRGYTEPVTYTELEEAKSALAYYELGFIEKIRYVTKKYSGGSTDRGWETVRL